MNKQAKSSGSLYYCRLLFFTLLLPLLAAGTLAAPVIIIDEADERVSLANHVDILDDPGEKLTPDLILGSSVINEFRPADLSELRELSEYSDHFWLRFSIHNTTGQPQLFWLPVNEGVLQNLLLYSVSNDGRQEYTETGDALFQDGHTHPIIKEIQIPAKVTMTFLAKIKVLDRSAMEMELVKSSRFMHQQILKNQVTTFGLGILSFLTLSSLFFALYRRSNFFLYFGLYGLCMTGIAAIAAGIPRNCYPGFTEWKYPAIFCFYYLAAGSGLTGMQQYLKQTGSGYSSSYRNLILAQYLNFFAFVPLFIFFDAYSFLNHLPAIVAILAIIDAALHSFRKHDDSTALGGAIIILLTLSAMLFFAQSQSSTFGLTQLTTPVSLYTIVLCNSVIFALLVTNEFRMVARDFRYAMLDSVNDATNKAQNRILSEISHDIRTPISGILGMSDLLKLSSLTINQQEKVDAIRNAGQALLDKVSEIHNRVQLQQNNSAVKKHPFELPLLVETCINSFRLMAEAKNTELITHIQADVPAIVMGDESRLRQILILLISNALRNATRGEVLINVSRLASSRGTILFSVRDAIKEPDMPDNPGTPFGTYSKKTVADDKAGIETARQLLAQLKSELEIRNHPANGSESSFSLVLPQATMAISSDSDTIKKILSRKRLLVVDDNQTCCKVLKQQASGWGMSVKEALGGGEAIAMFRAMKNINEPFDAIIIDYDMPNLKGTEVAERITAESVTPPIMIMLTGLSVAPADEVARKAGIATILTKPSSEKLIQMTLVNLFQEREKKTSEEIAG